jgi:hypothetical protein
MKKIHTYIMLMALLIVSCDTVNDTPITPIEKELQLPQSAVEAVKSKYPDYQELKFNILVPEKLWLIDFFTIANKNSTIVDFKGQFVADEKISGSIKKVPTEIKNYIYSKYQNSVLISVAEVIKDKIVDGYKVIVLQENNTRKTLRFNALNEFIQEENKPGLALLAVYLTNTDQVATNGSVPDFVKKFIKTNSITNAGLAVYIYVDNSVRVIATNRAVGSREIVTTEITFDEKGVVTELISPIEKEISYESFKKESLPSEIATYLEANLPSSQMEYGLKELTYDRTQSYDVFVKVDDKTSYLLYFNGGSKKYLKSIKNSKIDATELPEKITIYLNTNYIGWNLVNAEAFFSSNFEDNLNEKTSVARYTVEFAIDKNTKQVVVFANDGTVQYQYKR